MRCSATVYSLRYDDRRPARVCKPMQQHGDPLPVRIRREGAGRPKAPTIQRQPAASACPEKLPDQDLNLE